MRKQIAAANWKMNKRLDEGKTLLENILNAVSSVNVNQEVVFAVPFPYLVLSP
jgi:triosephosphate isomerase